MKTYIIFVTLVVALFGFGCTKSNLVENDYQTATNQIKSTVPSWIYFKNGIEVTNIDSLVDFEIAFIEAESRKVFFFTDCNYFNAWAKDFYLKDGRVDIMQVNKNINLISDYAFASGADLFYEQHGYISNDMLDFMYAHGMPANTRLAVRELYDNINFQNQIHFSAMIPIPSLRNANNRAESLRQTGVLALNAYFDRTWFRGDRFFVFNGTPSIVSIPDLGVFNFRNRIESILPVL